MILQPRHRDIALPGRDFPYPKPKREAITAFGFGHSMPFKGTPSTVSNGGGGGGGDPFWDDVSLLIAGDDLFTDLSPNGRSPTTITGPSPTDGGSVIDIVSTTGIVEWAYPIAPANSPGWTIEYFIELIDYSNDLAFFWDRYGVAGITTSSEEFGDAGLASCNNTTVNNTFKIGYQIVIGNQGLASNRLRHHVAFEMFSDGYVYVFYNGYFGAKTNATGAPYSDAVTKFRIGNLRYNNGTWHTAKYDNIRITNAARYDPTGFNSGESVFTPPPTPFPTS